jgi:hypothetical protein
MNLQTIQSVQSVSATSMSRSRSRSCIHTLNSVAPAVAGHQSGPASQFAPRQAARLPSSGVALGLPRTPQALSSLLGGPPPTALGGGLQLELVQPPQNLQWHAHCTDSSKPR